MRFLDKRGELGEGVLMIYRLALVSLVALVVLGLSSAFYDYSLDARAVEGILLTSKVYDCISEEGVLKYNLENLEKDENVLGVCGFKNLERYYIKGKVLDGSNVLGEFAQGDEGVGWVREISSKAREGIEKYVPGYFIWAYPLKYENKNVKLVLEVLIKSDDTA